jgi:hypothetical protein
MTALSKSHSGLVTISGTLSETLSGEGGALGAQNSFSYANAIKDANLDGWVNGELTLGSGAFGSINLGHASDPFGSFGSAQYQPGGFAITANTELAFLYMEFVSTTATTVLGSYPRVTVSIDSTGGLAALGHNANNIVAQLGPGDAYFNCAQVYGSGSKIQSAAKLYLQNNDGSSGACTVKIVAGYRNAAFTE